VDAAIFIDAAVDVSRVSVRDVKCAERADIVAHSNSPEVMLAFAKAAFGHAPRAWLVSVPAVELGFRTTLTGRASRGAVEATQKAVELIKATTEFADRDA
jgi:Ni,Fe-hydrogenase maturation factor